MNIWIERMFDCAFIYLVTLYAFLLQVSLLGLWWNQHRSKCTQSYNMRYYWIKYPLNVKINWILTYLLVLSFLLAQYYSRSSLVCKTIYKITPILMQRNHVYPPLNMFIRLDPETAHSFSVAVVVSIHFFAISWCPIFVSSAMTEWHDDGSRIPLLRLFV